MAIPVDVATASPPSTFLALSEGWRALLEASSLIPTLPLLDSLPKGDGHPVYVLPGFMADSQSTGMLRRWLDRLGYNTIPWGFGRNLGPRGNLQERMVQTVANIARHYDQPVSLIGQSLGGVFAREIAKVLPNQVRQIITLGSPFGQTNVESTYPAVRRLFELATGEDLHNVRKQMVDLPRPAPVPCTAVFSRSDGIAHWKTCIERETAITDNVEVFASHCGMGFNPAIYYVIADRLCLPRGAWKKFDRSGWRALVFPGPVYAATPPAPEHQAVAAS
jgi:pimeloyl-ACP methyl ester carboxylesterase